MLPLDEVPVTLARAVGSRGEVVLRSRDTADGLVYELIVNGVFAMDTHETTSEWQLGRVALGTADGGRVLLGGLGLGCTAWAVLSHQVSGIDIVEIEESLIDWANQGLTPMLARVAADPRVRLYPADVATVLAGSNAELHGPWQAILLDVDNGPDFLIHPGNASLYTPDALRGALAQLTPAGTLAIWCQSPSPRLFATLTELAAFAEEHLFSVQRGERRFAYAIYTARRPLTDEG